MSDSLEYPAFLAPPTDRYDWPDDFWDDAPAPPSSLNAFGPPLSGAHAYSNPHHSLQYTQPAAAAAAHTQVQYAQHQLQYTHQSQSAIEEDAELDRVIEGLLEVEGDGLDDIDEDGLFQALAEIEAEEVR